MHRDARPRSGWCWGHRPTWRRRNARAASEAKAEERKAQRDDHQRQVLTDLLDALGDYNEMFGRQLRDTEDHGVISDETTTKAFSAGGRVDRLVAQIRNQELRTQLADYRRLLLRLVIAYDPGHLLEAVQQVHDPNRELLDAIHAELKQYL